LDENKRLGKAHPLSLPGCLLLLCLQAASANPAGVQVIDKVIMIPKPPWSAVLTTSGVLATWLSHVNALDRREFVEQEVDFVLADGTRAGGLLFPRAGQAPLLLATFGFLADRWSKPAAQFVDDYLIRGSFPAHVLILDHPSSAPFLAANGELSLGGLDEGQMVLEVARQLRGGGAAKLELRISSYHLLGVSMGGLGVLYAVREDARSASPILGSAAVFSSVTRLDEVRAHELVTRGRVTLEPERRRALSPAALLGAGIFRDLREHFRSSYRERTGERLDWSDDDTGQRLYELMERRVRRLFAERKNGVAFDSLDGYMEFNNVCGMGEDVAVPLVMIHARDDPVVPVSHLECFEKSASSNPNVSTYVTNNGGHWGFARTYGRDWIAAILEAVLSAGAPR